MYSWRWVRWTFRSPLRAVGGLAVVYLFKELLGFFGVFDWMHQHVTTWVQRFETLKLVIEESSEWAAGWMETLGMIWGWISTIVDLWKLPFILIALGLVVWYGREVTDSTTPLETPAASQASTPAKGSPRSDALQVLSSSIETQTRAMESLVTKLQKIESQQNQGLLWREAEEHANHARQQAQQESQERSWKMMRDRVDAFERVLKEDRSGAGAASAQGSTGGPALLKGETQKSTGGPSQKISQSQEKKGSVEGSSGDPEMSILIKKL